MRSYWIGVAIVGGAVAFGATRWVQTGQPRLANGQRLLASPGATLLPARPVDVAISPDGTLAAIKENLGVTILRLADQKILGAAPIQAGTSLTGIAWHGPAEVLVTDAHRSLVRVTITVGVPLVSTSIDLGAARVGGDSFPCGLAVSADGGTAYVALNRDNSLAVVDLATGSVSKIDTDVAPFAVAVDGNDAFVSCWARPKRAKTSMTAESSGTTVEVDRRGIGVGGSLVKVDLAQRRIVRRIALGRQPTEVALTPQHAWVTISNDDQIVSIDRASFRINRNLRTADRRPGDAPNALAAASDDQVWVAYGGRNSIVGFQGGSVVEKAVDWYPAAVRLAGNRLVVACAKGIGSRGAAEGAGRHSAYDFSGTVRVMDLPPVGRLAGRPVPLPPRKNVAAVPIPARDGEPSVFKHVVYVIKENRTYDQVFGDVAAGNGDPKLTIYGEKITPNQHALAREFALLDNFYCNGVNSADGHAWSTEANATTYFERSFGGWTRSYPFGDDPLATSSTGYLWDNALDHGKTFRNYGEFDYAEPVPALKFSEIYRDFTTGRRRVQFRQKIGVARIRAHSVPGYPGWNMQIPDVVRADAFIRDFARREMAQLTIVYLPQDHTSGLTPGAPSPRAHVADNDLALGRVVEAISKSRYWPTTAIFVVEDDAQDGFDHVDGHRSPCQVISPYTRRGEVVSEFYNQTSVLHTIERILGLPPMNRFDADSPIMNTCFQSRLDARPYRARPAQVRLDELNPPAKVTRLNLARPDDADEDELNLQQWRAARGNAPYPGAK